MKYLVITCITLLFINPCHSQEAEEIYSVAKVRKSYSYFVEQAGLWWAQIEQDKQNEEAWFNYFKANRMARISYNPEIPIQAGQTKWIEGSQYLMKGNDILDQAEKHIPTTFSFHFMKWWNDGAWAANFHHLQKAYELRPDYVDLYDGFVTYYETERNLAKRKEFNQIWYDAKDISPGLLNYSYNVLASIADDGILFTYGDNDTYPPLMLQDVFGIKPNAYVLCLPLLELENYRSRLFNELGIPVLDQSKVEKAEEKYNLFVGHIIKHLYGKRPIYFGSSALKRTMIDQEKLYLLGLAIQYSEENVDNIAHLKNNFENLYALDYIRQQFAPDMSLGLVELHNLNYMPGIIKLYEHYKLSGDMAKANQMKDLGLLVASKGGNQWYKKAKQLFE